jgi:protein-disulfide isomerase
VVLLVGAAAAAAALLAAALHWASTPAPEAAVQAPAALEPGGKTRGRPDAPVTVQVFSDFLCIHCATMGLEVKPALVAEFVEPGVVRLIYRHFPVLGPLSEAAALAGECAAAQQRFWAFHDAVFRRTARRTLRGPDDLTAAAREARLDTAALAACQRTPAARAGVDADRNEGLRRGVEGTPTLFVGNKKIVGAPPYEMLRGEIRAAQPR